MQPNAPQYDPQGQGRAPQYAPGSPSADPRAQLATGVERFMTRVNAWMAAGIAVTGIVAFLVAQNAMLMSSLFGTNLVWLVLFGPFLFVMLVSRRVPKMSPPAAIASFMVLSILYGLSLSSIFVVYSLGSIAFVFAITALTYGSLALWGFATKRDLSGWGSFLFMAFIGLLLSGFAFMLIPGAMGGVAGLIYNVVGVLLFAGLTAYNTQTVKQIYLVNGSRGNLAILGALTLYLSFMNLFIFLMSIFGGGRD